MNVLTVDISNFKSGKEFAEFVNQNSNCCCFELTGENEVLNKINEVENVPKFNLGDKVRLNTELCEFNGVSNEETYYIVGMEKVEEQFLYVVRNNFHRYEFFGYELEKAI